MKLSEFYTQVAKQGLAKNNRWICTVYPPSGLTATGRSLSNVFSKGGTRVNVNLPGFDLADTASNALTNLGVDIGSVQIQNNISIPTLGYVLTNMGDKMNALNMFTHDCQLPGREIQTAEFAEYGEKRNLGVIHTHGDLTINYHCSEDLREKLFFEQWQDLIFNPSTKQHSYYKDYISSIDITKYDSAWHKKIAVYRFNEVFPSNMTALELSSEAGEYLRISITFKYRNYEIVGPSKFEKAKDKAYDAIDKVTKPFGIF